MSGRSVVWLARLFRVQEVVSSNLTAPTIFHLHLVEISAENEKEFAAVSRLTAHADATAMGDNDFPGNGESQADAAFGLTGHAIEAVKNQALVFGGDVRPFVADTELHAAIGASGGGDLDFSTGRRMFYGAGNRIS